MEQVPQKKQIKGEDFIEILAARKAGNPKPPTTPEDEAAKYAAKTKAVEAQDQYLTTVDKIKNPPSVVEMQRQDSQRLAEEKKEEKTRADAAEQRERERIQNEATEAKKTAAEAEQKRIAAEQNLQAQQNQILLDKLEELKSSQKPLSQQFEEYFAFADKVAEKMGYQKPGTKPVSENPQIALEIAKLDLQSAREDRKQQLEIEQMKFDREMALIKMQDDRDFKKQELAHQAKRDETLFSFPQILGGAIAKGIIDHEAGVAAPPGLISQKPQSTVKLYRIEVGQGQPGEFECPNCHTPVAIGPTSTAAQCVGCNSQFPIDRVPITEGTKEPLPPVKEEE